MNRGELAALRDAIDAVLKWPSPVFDEVVRWLAPAAVEPNGLDAHPPLAAPTPAANLAQAQVKTKTTKRANPHDARKAEQRLIAAMKDNPGLSVIALANAANAGRSSTGERLRRLFKAGMVEKDRQGRWRLAAEKARPTGEESRPIEASPSL